MSDRRRNICFILLLIKIKGEPMDLHTDGKHYVITELTSRGVDPERCHQMVYQVKACASHGFSLLGQSGDELVEFVVGGWSNRKSTVRILHESYRRYQAYRKPQKLNCTEYRWFWMSWGNGHIKYGQGKVPGQSSILDLAITIGDLVKKMGLTGLNGVKVWTRLGETGRGNFERVAEEGKFSDGLIEEIPRTTLVRCAAKCSSHTDCGMYSYNNKLGLCGIFNRMTSSFVVTSQSGWKSWKMMYCYP